MKEKLVEIVKKSLVKNIDYTHRLAENITDDLLANGVIAPPCKVGDAAYYISMYYTGKFQVYKCFVEKITLYETNTFLSLADAKDKGIYFGVNCKDPSLFFDLEKAKKELERMNNHGT